MAEPRHKLSRTEWYAVDLIRKELKYCNKND